MKNFFKYGVFTLVFVAPVVALAQFGEGGGEINRFLQGVTLFIQQIVIPILIAVAFVVFIYGAIRYFLVADSSGGEDSREAGRRLMFWGIIGFVIIVSVWGIVALIANGLGFGGADDKRLDVVPNVPKSTVNPDGVGG